MASNSLKSSEGKQVAAIGLPSIDHGSMEYGLDLERAGLSGRPRRSSCTIWPSMLLVLEVDRPRNELLNEQSGFLVLSGYSASFFRFQFSKQPWAKPRSTWQPLLQSISRCCRLGSPPKFQP